MSTLFFVPKDMRCYTEPLTQKSKVVYVLFMNMEHLFWNRTSCPPFKTSRRILSKDNGYLFTDIERDPSFTQSGIRELHIALGRISQDLKRCLVKVDKGVSCWGVSYALFFNGRRI